MQVSIVFALLLVASTVSANQPENVSVEHSAPVVGNSPPVVAPVVGSPGVVEVSQQAPNVVVEHQPPHQHASYYSPSGVITVVGEQASNSKPGQFVRSYEQYGQPEPASIPPNYKPFGSWGLYIGGNPADGYYTNYYKALGNSVDKQQVGEPVKPVVGVAPNQVAAFSPILKQAGSSPFAGADYYPFAYSPSDLSSSGRSSIEPSVHSAIHSPSDPSYLAYADSYATKKIGSAYAQKEATKEVAQPVVQQPHHVKGYAPHQQYRYVYPPVAQASYPVYSAPVVVPQPPQHVAVNHHVVPYPVPVGSQIVGSQQGLDGAFSPYGIHAFTKYAVKPTVVSHEPSYYYGAPNPQQSTSYKHLGPQHYSSYSSYGVSSYPFSFYGFPLSQIHSQGVHHNQQQGAQVVPVSHVEASPVVHQVVSQPAQVEPVSSEKVEEKQSVSQN